jgi:hypothetical protein
MKVFQMLMLALALAVSMIGNAFAALTLPALATTDVETAAGTVFAGLAVIWAIRKLVKLLNRS